MKLLIFDFDNTLGDTYGPYGEGNIFRTKTLPDREKAAEIYNTYRRGTDDIVAYPTLLDLYGISDPEKFFIDAGMPQQIFPDVVPFFRKLKEYNNIKTVILTTGDEDFQRVKMKITGIGELVDEVYITRERNKVSHIKNLIEKYTPEVTYFIDDRIYTMTSEDFEAPVVIYEMDRAGKKKGKNIIHGLDDLPLTEILGKK